MSLAAKHRRQAAEYEQQQQFDRALTAYVAAIQEDDAARKEVDVALLNKVGDLALRLGRIPESMTYYERAVEYYANAGRHNNAIALCNKILRTTPGRTPVYLTLGRICARKGMRSEASRNFLEYATRMQREARASEAGRLLAEAARQFPELSELPRLVAELGGPAVDPSAAPAPREPQPSAAPTASGRGAVPVPPAIDGLVFLDVDYQGPDRAGSEESRASVPTPVSTAVIPPAPERAGGDRAASASPVRIGDSLEGHLLFDPAVNQVPPVEPPAVSVDAAAVPSLLDGGEFSWELPHAVAPLEGMEEALGGVDVPAASLDELLVEESLADVLDPLHDRPPAPHPIPTPRDESMPGMARAIAEGERLVATEESRSVESVLAAAEAVLVPAQPFQVLIS